MGFPLESLHRLLGYSILDERTIEVGVAGLLHTFFGIIDFKLESVNLFIALLFSLFKENPIVVRVLRSISYLLKGDTLSLHSLSLPLIQLFLHHDMLKSSHQPVEIDPQILEGLGIWLKAILSFTNPSHPPS